MLINQNNGHVCLRKITDAFNVYVHSGTTPDIRYGTLEYAGSIVHYAFIHPSEDTVLTLDYAGDRPRFLTDIRNHWFLEEGFHIAVQLSGGYFDNHPSALTYGRPVGALLRNWSRDWERHRGYICYPAKGKGYPTIYSDGYSLHWKDAWQDEFLPLLGSMYWALGAGQSLTLNGRVDCSVGEENGRYHQKKCTAMIGITKDGDWLLAVNTGAGLDHLTRAYLMRDLGAYTSFDLDGGGSTHFWIDDPFVNNKPATSQSTAAVKVTPDQFYAKWNGKRIDRDGNGFWCVDAFKQWCHEVLGYEWPTKNGWADGYWYYRQEHAKEFDFISDPAQFQDGDWVIWPRDGKQPCPDSHIAMYYHGKCFGMRQGGKSHEFQLKKISFQGVLGALRWKGYTKEKYDIDSIANEVIAGQWGNGADRKKRLTAAGFSYALVQERVNELLKGGN